MKTNRICVLLSLAGGLALVSGCVVAPDGTVRVAPIVVAPPVVEVTAPAVEVEPAVVEVPDTYVWDGVEFVGFVDGGYFYLGPGDVWIACDSVRVARFHDWERFHPDWRDHAIRNDRYRRDAHGHFQAVRHDERVQPGHARPEREKAAPKPREDEHH